MLLKRVYESFIETYLLTTQQKGNRNINVSMQRGSIFREILHKVLEMVDVLT